MMLKENKIIDFFKSGGRVLGELAIEIYGRTIDQKGEQAFSEAIEIGIKNTVTALYSAKVEDKEILRVLSETWGISLAEAEERLLLEKPQAAIRSLKHFLRLQGNTSPEIEKYMRESRASMHIRCNKDLWKLRENPEKLLRELQIINQNRGGR